MLQIKRLVVVASQCSLAAVQFLDEAAVFQLIKEAVIVKQRVGGGLRVT